MKRNSLFIIVFSVCMLIGCSPKIVTKTEKVIEYKDRIIVDTARVEIPVEVEKIVTIDTASHLENTYAKSDAIVSKGMLHHSLESKPQIIKVPVEVIVTDTVYREAEIITRIEKVPAELSYLQRAKINMFYPMIACIILLITWVFRKYIFKFLC